MADKQPENKVKQMEWKKQDAPSPTVWKSDVKTVPPPNHQTNDWKQPQNQSSSGQMDWKPTNVHKEREAQQQKEAAERREQWLQQKEQKQMNDLLQQSQPQQQQP